MIFSVIRDIEEALSSLFPINLFLVNDNGQIHWANETMLKSSGFNSIEEIQGKHVELFGNKEWSSTQNILDNKNRKILYEYHDAKKFLVIKSPYIQESFTGVLGLSIDITQLEQAERTKHEFLQNMTHDIRTPFCGIITILENLVTKEQDHVKKNWLEMVWQSSQYVLQFLNDVCDIAQKGQLPLSKTCIDMEKLISEITLLLTPALRSKRLEFSYQYAGNTQIYSDHFRIQQILLNLLGNAVKFTMKGSIQLSVIVNDNLITLHIKDTGIGIASSCHAKIFEDCFKVGPSYKQSIYAGIGKGLFLTKNYVEDLQGKITVESALGKGSCFSITIPLGVK